MYTDISKDGSASPELREQIQRIWCEAAVNQNFDLTGYDPQASLSARIVWATACGLSIGGILSRYSSKLQHSTTAQVRDNLLFAAANRIYVPPEYVCVDEAVSGRKSRRDGLERMTALLQAKLVHTLLVFKVSRLFRVPYLGFKFFQEEIVEENLRAISISQGIDTADQKAWKKLAYLHGIMDEMLLEAIADHVRSGLSNLFQQGYVTGALTIGYIGREVPGPLTKLGRPRRMPAVDTHVAALIVSHFQFIRDGMPIREGWKRWVAAGGPCDARSSGRMTYGAYRRMLSNSRYIGCWAFGRKRNQWSTKRDYNRPTEQPETEVLVVRSDELRIVDDELFYAVQQRLTALKHQPRGPKRRAKPELWDLVTDCFYCAACSNDEVAYRFHQAGAGGHGMRCKRPEVCPCLTVVKRREAVRAVCAKLSEMIASDADLLTRTCVRAPEIDARGDESFEVRLAETERKIAALGRKISDLTDLAGDGSDQDRAETKKKIRATQAERAAKQAEQAELKTELSSAARVITADEVRAVLGDVTTLLENGANGTLGDDVVYRAADLFRQLVDGRILVHVEARPGRKRTNVWGAFTCELLKQVEQRLGPATEAIAPLEVRVMLRKPPRLDELASKVHELIDLERLSFPEAARKLKAAGQKVNERTIYRYYYRYYEMLGLPVPKRKPGRSSDDSSADDAAA